MKQNYFTVLKDGAIFTTRDSSTFMDKTSSEILQTLKIEDSIFCFFNKKSLKPLKDTEKPLKTYKQLNGSRPTSILDVKCALVIKPKDFESKFSVFIRCKTQLDDENMPNFPVTLEAATYKSLKIPDFVKLVSEQFDLPHTEPELYVDKDKCKDSLTGEKLVKLAEDDKLVFHCVLEEKGLYKIRMRKRVVTEIGTSEQSYIADLNTLLNYFKPALEKHKLLTQDENQLLFKDIGTILSTHAHFYSSLISRGVGYDAVVSDCLIEFSQFFKLSMNYIGNYDMISKVAMKLPEQTMNEIVQRCPLNESGRNLSSFLITPVQRIPRYVLFIKELLKMTPKCHPDADALNVAFEKIDTVTRYIQEQSDRNEAARLLMELQNKLTPATQIIAPRRSFLQTINVMVNDGGQKEGCIHMFSDLFLVTLKIKKDEKEKVVLNLSYQKVSFDPSTSETSIQFIVPGFTNTIEFQDNKVKMDFLQKFAEAAKENIDHSENLDKSLIWECLNFSSYPPQAIQHDAAVIGECIFFLGGFIPKPVSSLPMPFIIFKPLVNKFNISEQMTIPVVGGTLSHIDNTFYLFGGIHQEKKKPISKTYFCPYGASKWEVLNVSASGESHTPSRAFHSSVTYKNIIYVFGGINKKSECVNSTYSLDVSTGTWKEIEASGEIPPARMRHSAVVADHYMIIHGGKNSKTDMNDIWALDLETFKWTELKSMNGEEPLLVERFSHRAFVTGHYLFIIGGINNANEVMPTYAYDLNTGNVETLEDIGNVAHIKDFALAVINDVIYIFGGSDTLTKIPRASFIKVTLPQKYTKKDEKTPVITLRALIQEKAKRPINVSAEAEPAIKPLPNYSRGSVRANTVITNASVLNKQLKAIPKHNQAKEAPKQQIDSEMQRPKQSNEVTKTQVIQGIQKLHQIKEEPIIKTTKEQPKQQQTHEMLEPVNKAPTPQQKEEKQGDMYDKFDVDSYSRYKGIDTSKLVAFQVRVVTQKLRNLWNLEKENAELESKVAGSSGQSLSCSAQTSLLVSFFDKQKRKSCAVKFAPKTTFNDVLNEAKKLKAGATPYVKCRGQLVQLTSANFNSATTGKSHIKIVI